LVCPALPSSHAAPQKSSPSPRTVRELANYHGAHLSEIIYGNGHSHLTSRERENSSGQISPLCVAVPSRPPRAPAVWLLAAVRRRLRIHWPGVSRSLIVSFLFHLSDRGGVARWGHWWPGQARPQAKGRRSCQIEAIPSAISSRLRFILFSFNVFISLLEQTGGMGTQWPEDAPEHGPQARGWKTVALAAA
jgi:hypothetical protein